MLQILTVGNLKLRGWSDL